jgi:deoxyribodipyrimidine photo-lyase
MKTGIFIFHRDLRIVDNLGLIDLQKKCKSVIPIFIFDPHQLNKNNHYFSNPACKFLCESVTDLYDQTNNNLCIFHDHPLAIIKKITKMFNSDDIVFGFNVDYTQYSMIRDNEIIEYLKKQQIECIINGDDFTLVPMDLLKNHDVYFKKYNSFRQNLLKHKNKISVSNKKITFSSLKISDKLHIDDINSFYKLPNTYSPIEIGTRKNALKIIKNLKHFNKYNDLRDILSYNTTHISAYLNFGLISEREFYVSVNKSLRGSLLTNQIIWRDYYLCILRYEKLAKFYNKHIDDRYNKIKWKKSKKTYNEWDKMMESKTGFLLIDACISELLNTGFVHNRGRLILGYFSVKYLHINPLQDWYGLHSWFSRYLVDCITSQNKLNCQFITELDYSGKQFSKNVIDGRPFNITNEMIKKYDPSCEYIKKWLPHLKNVDVKTLYKWSSLGDKKIHPLPIFDPKVRYQEWIDLCKL